MNEINIAQRTEDGKLPFVGKWYLVLRMSEAEPEFASRRTGFQKVVSADYMGAAEFEWGAIPAAYKVYREAAVAGDLTVTKSKAVLTTGEPFWILHHKDYDPALVEARILEDAQEKHRLKEPTNFYRWFVTRGFHRPSNFYLDTTFWMVMGRAFDYVCWGVNQATVEAFLKEAASPPDFEVRKDPDPVHPVIQLKEDRAERNKRISESLTLFQEVDVNVPAKFFNMPGPPKLVKANVVGIYDNHFDIQLASGQRFKGISYHALVENT